MTLGIRLGPMTESRLYKISHWAHAWPKANQRYQGARKLQYTIIRIKDTKWQCSLRRFDLGLVEQNHVQQGIVDLEFPVIFDKTQFAEFAHEKAHARSGRSDHLRQCFLTKRCHDRLRPAFLG